MCLNRGGRMQTILEVGGSDRCMVWVTLIFLQGKWFFYAAFLVLMNTRFYRHKSDLPIQTHSYTVQIVNQWFWQFPIRIFTMTQLGLNCWPYTAWPTVHHIISVHVPMFFFNYHNFKDQNLYMTEDLDCYAMFCSFVLNVTVVFGFIGFISF